MNGKILASVILTQIVSNGVWLWDILHIGFRIGVVFTGLVLFCGLVITIAEYWDE